MRAIFAKFPSFSKIYKLYLKNYQKLSVKLHHHCNQYAQKPICRDFQVISSSYFLVKTTC